MTKGTAELVFDGALLRATLARPRHPKDGNLYVTFRQRLAEPGKFWAHRPARSAMAQGYGHLHIQTLQNDWYINSETTDLGFVLRGVRQQYDRVVAIGFSMGGFAALRFSADLDVSQVLLISPQYTLNRDIVFEDRRYPEAKGFDPILGDLALHAKREVAGVVMYDRFRPLDHLHASLITEVFAQISPAPLGFAGHPATQVLRGAGAFGTLQRLALQTPLSAAGIVGLHRVHRAASPQYWQQRALICDKRGHPAAAAAARLRESAFGQNDGHNGPLINPDKTLG